MDQNATIAKNLATNLLIAIVLEVEKQVRVHMRRIRKAENKKIFGSSANVANHSKMMKRGGTMFAFSATSSFCCISTKLRIPAKCCSTILDSGASHHYCPDKSKFKNITPISDVIKLADCHTLPALGIGDVYPMTISGIKSCFKNVLMHLIWHSPSF